ncbi:MAG: tryptophan--tRNA ligase [Candidatus Shikimatogenerans sp. JK-2022]|nr:tryptophan--tRNA ligase [Candidatus Shikimatogenerans bostrichidophilus]
MLNNNKLMTAIKTTGIPHLGNILSIIKPILKIINNNIKNKKIFIFIADLHAITNYQNNKLLVNNIYKNAAVWLSFINIINNKDLIFYRQSDIKEITQLFWIINCFYPFNRLKLSHVYKIKKKINNGVFNYPILMASDILLYNINKVIIGKDQIQHIEITRKIAKIINYKLNKKLFTLPKYYLKYKFIIPGIDGQKMSKSNNNIINIFDNIYNLEKQIMNIITINKSINNLSYKDIKKTILFKIYNLIANKEQIINLKEKIKNNKISFYKIKKLLINIILKNFKNERIKYIYYLNNKNIINNILYKGYKKSKKIAKNNFSLIKKEIGLNI